MFVCMGVYLYLCMCLCVCMCVCMCVCLSFYGAIKLHFFHHAKINTHESKNLPWEILDKDQNLKDGLKLPKTIKLGRQLQL